MKLYYDNTINPRKACAVARHLQLPVEFVHVRLLEGEHRRPGFLALNPNGRLPVLEDAGRIVWEGQCHHVPSRDRRRFAAVAQRSGLASGRAALVELGCLPLHAARRGFVLRVRNQARPRLGRTRPANSPNSRPRR